MHTLESGEKCRFIAGHGGKCSLVKLSVYDEIRQERKAQDKKWGGAAHDDVHTQFDWCEFIRHHTNRAVGGRKKDDYRKQMIRVAALAVAAVQSFDRIHGKTKG